MNKKLVVVGAALLASTASVQARVTGFYVGIQGGIDLAQFKIYDGTSHTGGTMSHTTGSQAMYPASGEGFTINGGALDIRTNGGYNDGSNQTVSVNVPSVLAGNDDFEATPEYVYKVRPAGEIFVGYNYQVGSNFVVGVEIKGGLTFGSHKYDASVRIPDLICYKNVKGNEGSNQVTDLTDTDDETDKAYYKGQYRPTTFELNTKFTGDLSLRLGCVIPGTDGRLAVFLRGGVGLVRQELTFNQKGSGALYYEAMANAAYKAANMEFEKHLFELNGAAESTKDDVRGKQVSAGYLRDLIYFTWPITAMNELPLKHGSANASSLKGTLNNPNEAGGKFVGQIAENILAYATTASYGIASEAEALALLPSVDETKNRFTWHAGIDGEYHFANGLFVRASYTFKYVKGFFAENKQDYKSLSKSTVKEIARKAVESGILDSYILGARGNDDALVVTVPSDQNTLRKLVAERFAGLFEHCPEQVSLGTLNTKVGTNKKSFGHHFTIGVGFKFCM